MMPLRTFHSQKSNQRFSVCLYVHVWPLGRVTDALLPGPPWPPWCSQILRGTSRLASWSHQPAKCSVFTFQSLRPCTTKTLALTSRASR